MVRDSVEETLNEPLEDETKKLILAAWYEYSKKHQGYPSGHYHRKLTTPSEDVPHKAPKLKGASSIPLLLSGIAAGRTA